MSRFGPGFREHPEVCHPSDDPDGMLREALRMVHEPIGAMHVDRSGVSIYDDGDGVTHTALWRGFRITMRDRKVDGIECYTLTIFDFRPGFRHDGIYHEDVRTDGRRLWRDVRRIVAAYSRFVADPLRLVVVAVDATFRGEVSLPAVMAATAVESDPLRSAWKTTRSAGLMISVLRVVADARGQERGFDEAYGDGALESTMCQTRLRWSDEPKSRVATAKMIRERYPDAPCTFAELLEYARQRRREGAEDL